MPRPTIENGEEYFFVTKYEGNGAGQRVGKFVPFTDNGTIANSCVFDDGSNEYLSRTPGSASNRRTFTFSCWIKLGAGVINSGAEMVIFSARDGSTDNYSILSINGDQSGANQLEFTNRTTSGYAGYAYTTRTLEDSSKWYHVMVAVDTTDSTTTDRIKLYIDGDRATVTYSDPGEDTDMAVNNNVAHAIGARPTNNFHWDGYIAEANFVDGTALGPETFGVTDTSTGRWIPKTLSGITYGTNGFRLTFQNNSALANLGYDYQTSDRSGTTNDFTVTNLATTDQTTDSPTQNHAVIGENGFSSISEGRLKAEGSISSQWRTGVSTLGMKSGKYYWEVKIVAHSNDNYFMFGICNESQISYLTAAANRYPGLDTESGSYGWQPNAGGDDDIRFNGNIVREETGTAIDNDTILQFAYDADTDRLWVGKDDTFLYSGDPANGTNYTISGIGTSETRYAALAIHNDTSHKFEVNFGQKSFAHTPPTDFVALQQDNLSTTDKGIVGLTWIKDRDSAYSHGLRDSSRGRHKGIFSNLTQAEATYTNGVQRFLKGGIEIEDLTGLNASGDSFVAWNWVANGGTVEDPNNDGSIASVVQANTTAGFSIVQYTGNATAGATVGHGLSQAPEFIVTKRLDSTGSWHGYHSSQGATKYFLLSSDTAFGTSALTWNNIAPNATTFTLGSGNTNNNTGEFVAYCWHGVEGFSKFGGYTGGGGTDGTFVYTGFRPAFVLMKNVSTGNWYLKDTTRDTFNPCEKTLMPNRTNFEAAQTYIDILSNGFKQRINNDASNLNGATYVYIAFAEHPFVGDGTSPVTAR